MGFVADFGRLLTGKAGAFVITVLSLPVISRLFEPDEFGVAALFIALSNILVVLATMRYEMALILPKSDAVAAALGRGVLALALAGCSVILVGLGVLMFVGVKPETFDRMGNIVWLMPLAVLALALVRLLEALILRRKGFNRLAASDLTQAGTNALGRIGAGAAFGSTVSGLLAGFLLGVAAKLTVLKSGLNSLVRSNQADHVPARQALRDYADFPKYNAPADLLRGLSLQLPLIMLGLIFAPAVVGLYAMASRLVLTPLGIVLQAFRRAFIQRTAVKVANGERLMGVYAKTLGTFALLGVIPFLVLLFFGQEILLFVLGENWGEAGRFAELLAPLLLAGWMVSPAATLLVVLRQQRIWLAVQVVSVTLVVGVFLTAMYLAESAETAIRYYVVVSVAINVLVIVLVTVLLKGQAGRSLEPKAAQSGNA